MEGIKFSVVNKKAKALCYEYSEDVEKLKAILEDPSFTLEVQYLYIDKYFPEDEDERQIIQFFISYKGKKFSSTFGMSLHDTEILKRKSFSIQWIKEKQKIHDNLLYDILCSLNSYIPADYGDFCVEFGYEGFDERGRARASVSKIWTESLDLYNKSKSLFGKDYTEYFPR